MGEGRLQGEKNRQTAQKIDYRMQDEKATGATLGSSLGNVGSYFNQNAALGNFGKGGFGGIAGASKMPTGTPAPTYYGGSEYIGGGNFG